MFTDFREKISDALLIFKESLVSFQKNNNLDKSAAFAYYGFFAMIPLLLLVIYILGNYILSSQTALSAVESLTSQIFPEFGKVITKEVYSLSRHKGVWGVISIITLFWSITPLTSTLRSAFISIFKTDKEIPFLKAKLLDAMTVLVILILFVVLVVSQIFYSMIVGMFVKTPFLLDVSNIITSVFLTMILMSVFYRAFSPVSLKLIHLISGAFLTAVLWAVMRPVFSLFLQYNPNYGYAFCSLKAIFILFVWVYYSFAVILLGAEVIANLKRKETLLLKGLFVGAAMSERKYRKISRRFVKTYNAGDVVFKEGEAGDCMFYILSGSVNIIKNEQVIRVMKQGEYFGEMSMLLNSPRTAAVIVREPDTQLVVISHDNFETILREEPQIALSLLKEMGERLKITSENL
jgi:membrane protein